MIILFVLAVFVLFIFNVWSMKKEYDKGNLIGVVYWGFWALITCTMLL